ncbi:MAG: ATPase, partial [Alphaproteobacteria bacterium]
MKRFYDTVAVQRTDGGYAIVLDGKPLRTPARRPLHVAARALA